MSFTGANSTKCTKQKVHKRLCVGSKINENFFESLSQAFEMISKRRKQENIFKESIHSIFIPEIKIFLTSIKFYVKK